jgi:hypothetical protein
MVLEDVQGRKLMACLAPFVSATCGQPLWRSVSLVSGLLMAIVLSGCTTGGSTSPEAAATPAEAPTIVADQLVG